MPMLLCHVSPFHSAVPQQPPPALSPGMYAQYPTIPPVAHRLPESPTIHSAPYESPQAPNMGLTHLPGILVPQLQPPDYHRFLMQLDQTTADYNQTQVEISILKAQHEQLKNEFSIQIEEEHRKQKSGKGKTA